MADLYVDWMSLLRQAVTETSQGKVAARLGYSKAAINQVLNGSYTASTDAIARRVVEVYGDRDVACPVLGTLPLARCAEERARPFSASNPLRVRLFRACRSCPNNPNRDE